MFCCTTVFADSCQKTTICKKNTYVAKCGSVTIGTNVLKGDTSNNFYDYSGQNNMVNLRLLFNGTSTDTMYYTNHDGNNASATSDAYSTKRNYFLGNVCNPVDVNEDFYTCLPCPNNGKVEESYVCTESSDNSTTFSAADSKFYTVANCYKTNFSDATGEFEYVTNDQDTAKCYYNVEIKGSVITLPTETGSQNTNAAQTQ